MKLFLCGGGSGKQIINALYKNTNGLCSKYKNKSITERLEHSSTNTQQHKDGK